MCLFVCVNGIESKFKIKSYNSKGLKTRPVYLIACGGRDTYRYEHCMSVVSGTNMFDSHETQLNVMFNAATERGGMLMPTYTCRAERVTVRMDLEVLARLLANTGE